MIVWLAQRLSVPLTKTVKHHKKKKKKKKKTRTLNHCDETMMKARSNHFSHCQGPVVQSVVSLTSSLRVISLTV